MEKDKYITLIYKQLKGEISTSESAMLKAWADKKENAMLKQEIETDWTLSKEVLAPITVDVKQDFGRFRKRMQQHKAQAVNVQKETKVRNLNWRRVLSIAAALTVLLIAVWWLVIPKEVPMLMAQTTINETKSVTLADGTKVTLNENSELHYPSSFIKNQRQVELKGEAFFEVEANPKRPFEISTSNAIVTVLGTIFNLRSYSEEQITAVNVEEGKVQLAAKATNKTILLTAGEQGQYNLSTQQLVETKVNNKNASAWKTKTLTYKSAPLTTVMSDIERHFKVKAVIQAPNMQQCPISARFPNATANNMLVYIANLYKMDLIELDDKNYQLKNGICK